LSDRVWAESGSESEMDAGARIDVVTDMRFGLVFRVKKRLICTAHKPRVNNYQSPQLEKYKAEK